LKITVLPSNTNNSNKTWNSIFNCYSFWSLK
jgi:hypothetical protein